MVISDHVSQNIALQETSGFTDNTDSLKKKNKTGRNNYALY